MPLRLTVRAVARALFVWGLAAAALSLAVMLNPTGSGLLRDPACAPPTDADAADLRAQAAQLLLSGAGQALAAQVALLAPWRPLTLLAWLVGTRTGLLSFKVLLRLVACRGHHLHGALALCLYLFGAMLVAAVIAAWLVALLGEE